MSEMTARPMPGTPAPALEVATADGVWRLADSRPESFTVVVFYRGLHCPVCKGFLGELDGLVPAYADVGAEVIAVSMDSAERAAQAVSDWGLSRLRVGHGLTEAQARAWGLYLSEAIRDTEPALFCEPGLFLIDGEGRFYLINIGSMPFARPDIAGLPAKIGFAKEKGYPARGTKV